MSTTASSYGVQSQKLAAPPIGSNGSIYSNGKAISAQNASAQNRGKFGGAASIVVPPVSVPYRETGSGSQTTSANITNSTKAQSQIFADKKFDNCVGVSGPCGGQSGGRRRKPKSVRRSLIGGWPSWRCMSGGTRRTCRRKGRRTCRKGRGRGKTCRGRRRK